MLNTGDFVFDTIEKANVQVLEKIEAWGYVSYKVFNPATGRVYKANEEQPVAFFLLLPAELFPCRTSFMC